MRVWKPGQPSSSCRNGSCVREAFWPTGFLEGRFSTLHTVAALRVETAVATPLTFKELLEK